MHRFNYKNKKFFCENISIESIAKKFGTPFYLYSYATLVHHFERIHEAFKDVDHLICFSMKANSNLAVISSIVQKGSGLDIVSGGELFKALKIKCPANRIVYASVGKRPDEIAEAIRRGILLFNVESEPELMAINKIAKAMQKKVSVALRLNPDVEAHTHKYITTGKSENKFGLDFNTARKIFNARVKYSNLRIEGVHIHIGSQITESAPFLKAIRKTLAFVDLLGIELKFFNIGGGLGIIYSHETPQAAADFAKKVLPLIKGRKFKLILEPGRFIVGNSGILVTKVVYVKKNPSGKHFAIVDAGMNDLIRPSLYEAYHEIIPVNNKGGSPKLNYDIVGPICESGDFLGKDRSLNKLSQDDLIAVMSAGAYGFTMSSNYNSRPKIAEIMVKNGTAKVVRERETYQDLIRGEKW